MPKLLKRDTIRHIESALEALSLAQIGICQHRRDELKISNVRFSPEIGLIGTALELIMSAILIQAYGKSSIIKEGAKRYKTAGEILHDFRSLLRDSPPVLNFMTNGIHDSKEHIDRILKHTLKFRIIITARANGLHAGMGVSNEVVFSVFNNITDFLKLISESVNFKPYLCHIPRLIGIKEPSELLIEDLIRKINIEKDTTEQKLLISSLVLVLPDIPDESPDWLEKFENFQLKPRKSTLKLLVNSLGDAFPVSFRKINSEEGTIPVKIDETNPDSLPIAPHYLRSEIRKIHEQWYSESGIASAQLEKKILDLPHEGTLYTVFTLGFQDTGILEPEKKFKGQRAWAFITKALKVSKNGNTYPFWFIIRNTEDFGQLKAQLKKAKKIANQTLKDNITNVIIGIEAIENKTSVSKSIPFYKSLFDIQNTFNNNIDKIDRFKSRTLKYPLDERYLEQLDSVIEGELHVGDLLNEILIDEDKDLDFKRYWAMNLSSLCNEIEDTPSLLSVLNDKELDSAHTWVRKAFRNIDFQLNGPKVE